MWLERAAGSGPTLVQPQGPSQSCVLSSRMAGAGSWQFFSVFYLFIYLFSNNKAVSNCYSSNW